MKKINNPEDQLTQFHEICARIGMGESVHAMCKEPGSISERQFYYMLSENSDLVQIYMRARETQADTHSDRMLDVARTEEDVNRARLIVDTMKWTASKLKPKVYGDKIQQEQTGGMTVEVIHRFDGKDG